MVLSHYNKIEHLIENCHQHGTQNAYKIHQKLTWARKWTTKAGEWTPETGKLILEAGKWTRKLENGDWKPPNGTTRTSNRGPGTRRPVAPPACPGSPGETFFKYIRSGPEGARGVSDDLNSPFFTHLLHSPSSLTLGCLWSGCLRNSLYSD